MYLESIDITNVGPIEHFGIKPEFADHLPRPLVLVGPNGSGKSTVLSFIVNALIGFKQQAYERAEIDVNRVYRIRGGLFLRGGKSYYHAKLDFSGGLSAEEWVLDRPRKDFEAQVSPLPVDPTWKSIPPDGSDSFTIKPQTRSIVGFHPDPTIERLFSENVVLFYPSDRFEPPDWLNVENLAADLRFPDSTVPFVGFTNRRIFSRSLLKPTLEWLQDVVFDWLLTDTREVALPGLPSGAPSLPTFIRLPGRNLTLIDSARAILGSIFGVPTEEVRLTLNQRHARRISAYIGTGSTPRQIPNLLGLSAGQSALFCLFCNILRDFDLTGAQFASTQDIRGIVVVDEIDLHLHMDLQFRALPRLMRLFPKVQFIVTAQSPFFALGMKDAFGDDGFSLLELPNARRVGAEAYSEFRDAFDTFRRTATFEQQLLEQLRGSTEPVVLCEGPTDAEHLNTAWLKLHPDIPNPFNIVACGGDASIHRGGAKTLKAILEALPWFEDRTIIGLFDNDRAGAEQFNSLRRADFSVSGVGNELVHAKKAVKALLLPVPAGREIFVPTAIESRLLEMEHYYTDDVLKRHGMIGDKLYDSSVFKIRDSAKKDFAQAIAEIDVKEFAAFEPLFGRLRDISGVSAPQAPAEAKPQEGKPRSVHESSSPEGANP